MKTVVLSAVAASIFATPGFAGEVGNILIPQSPAISEQTRKALDDQSRKASAAALAGIQAVISALQQSELRNLDQRKQKLAAAAESLHSAIGQMKAIEAPEINIDSAIKSLPPGDISFLEYVHAQILGKAGYPRTIRDLYSDFVEVSVRLDNEIRENSAFNGEKLPDSLVNSAARFLSFGNLVSRITEQAYGR